MTKFMKTLSLKIQLFIVFCLCLISQITFAQTNVLIKGIGGTRLPIVISSFNRKAAIPDMISPIVQQDLAQSGRFLIIENNATPVANQTPNYEAWKNKSVNALMTGKIRAIAPHQYQIHFTLYDIIKKQSLGGFSTTFSEQQAHLIAHQVADFIYQKLLGRPSIFLTRIAYVQKNNQHYQLKIADYDGQYPAVALNSTQPLISPAWSPDGRSLAYVSFEKQKPVVFIQQLATGKRTIASNLKGSNSAPAWSPDSQTLAVALSLAGNTQIYRLSVSGNHAPERLTFDDNISTEPCYSPDGQWIYFTSDRGGSPQIYKMPASGERTALAERITFNGNYNTSSSISPDGKYLAYISRSDQGFQLFVQNLSNGASNPVTNTFNDASPSFSANGQLILYSTEVNGKTTLAIAQADGSSPPIFLPLSSQGKVSESDWGPLNH